MRVIGRLPTGTPESKWVFGSYCVRCDMHMDIPGGGGRPDYDMCRDCRDVLAYSGTHCRAGLHPLTEANPGYTKAGAIRCKPCTSGHHSAQESRRRAALTACGNGHEYTPETLYINSVGRRLCRICTAMRSQKVAA